MRPIQLTMTAFGPYKGTETVDFRELRENRLFVISGATGAGKTTIFDGICFAFMDRRAEKTGQISVQCAVILRTMKYQTTVELTFEIHNRIYRILRQIPYVKNRE